MKSREKKFRFFLKNENVFRKTFSVSPKTFFENFKFQKLFFKFQNFFAVFSKIFFEKKEKIGKKMFFNFQKCFSKNFKISDFLGSPRSNSKKRFLNFKILFRIFGALAMTTFFFEKMFFGFQKHIKKTYRFLIFSEKCFLKFQKTFLNFKKVSKNFFPENSFFLFQK